MEYASLDLMVTPNELTSPHPTKTTTVQARAFGVQICVSFNKIYLHCTAQPQQKKQISFLNLGHFE